MFGKVAIILYVWLLSLLVDFLTLLLIFVCLCGLQRTVFSVGFLHMLAQMLIGFAKLDTETQKFLVDNFMWMIINHDRHLITDNPHQYSSWCSLKLRQSGPFGLDIKPFVH